MGQEIQIEILPWLSYALGHRSKIHIVHPLSLPQTLQSLLNRLAMDLDGFGVIYDAQHAILHDHIVIFVNNRPISKDLNIKVQAGDQITITPFYSGG